MSACCRPSPDRTLPYGDRLRRLRRRPIVAHLPPVETAVIGSLVVEAVVLRCSGRKWARKARDRATLTVLLNAVGERIGELEEEDAASAADEEGRKRAELVAAAAMTALLGTGNRVLYKLALVPLKQYPFFLAQLATFGYVVIYFSILCCRYQAGIITDDMLSLPKTPFMVVGLLEALGAASGMAAGAVLSGAWIPILSQTFLVWQLILSFIFLGRRYSANQVLGCILVSFGVVITVASGSGSGLSLQNVGIFWILLMIGSFFLQAADTVLKENIFMDSAKKLKGRSVDLFVVNSFGSAFQAMFICLLVPFLSKLWGIPFSGLPGYIKDGGICFLNIGKLSSGCEGAPMLPLLFVIVNMAFNISMLHLIKISSAVVSCLASTFSVYKMSSPHEIDAEQHVQVPKDEEIWLIRVVRRRGRTTCEDIQNLPAGTRVHVEINTDGVPCNSEFTLLASYLGVFAKDPTLALISFEDWRKPDMLPFKNRLLEEVEVNLNSRAIYAHRFYHLWA